MTECMLKTVFGTSSEEIGKLDYMIGGTPKPVYLGEYVNLCVMARVKGLMQPVRLFFDIFDKVCLNAEEREQQANCLRLRQLVMKIIKERKAELARPGVEPRPDFLTMMVQDELFKDQEEYVLDECISFIIAATLNNTQMITNSIYYLTKCQDKLAKLRREIVNAAGRNSFKGLSSEEWAQLLLNGDTSEDLMSRCEYIGYCVNETLRIDPSVRNSTLHEMTESVEIGGKLILKGQPIMISIA